MYQTKQDMDLQTKIAAFTEKFKLNELLKEDVQKLQRFSTLMEMNEDNDKKWLHYHDAYEEQKELITSAIKEVSPIEMNDVVARNLANAVIEANWK